MKLSLPQSRGSDKKLHGDEEIVDKIIFLSGAPLINGRYPDGGLAVLERDHERDRRVRAHGNSVPCQSVCDIVPLLSRRDVFCCQWIGLKSQRHLLHLAEKLARANGASLRKAIAGGRSHLRRPTDEEAENYRRQM